MIFFKSKTDKWQTPPFLYNALNKVYKFNGFDPCPLIGNTDNLLTDWHGTRFFVNPPFSQLKTTSKGIGWIEKCSDQAQCGKLVVVLAPARTDVVWFHEFVVKYGYKIRFIKGRLKFLDEFGYEQNTCPFPCFLIIMRPNNVSQKNNAQDNRVIERISLPYDMI